MRTDFKFSNLCGTVYKQGNLIFTPDGYSVISPVGNRVTVFDLKNNKSETLPFENDKNITHIGLTPNGNLLLSIDEDGKAVLVNFRRRAELHRFNFKKSVTALSFSPNGKFFVVAVGKQIEIWRTPGFTREFAPFILHRKYSGHYDDITHISWSSDSRFFLTSSKDMTTKIYSTDPIDGFSPNTLSGHRDAVVGAWFSDDMKTLYTVSKDGAVCIRKYRKKHVAEDLVFGEFPKTESGDRFVKTIWFTEQRQYFGMPGVRVQCAQFHSKAQLLIAGFSNGTFGIWEMPEFNQIHSLSISQNKINAAVINASGEWLAFGSAKLGQLLVWEWQSESYILKQQGHYHDVSCVAYSGDGQYIATGGDDGKVKIWNSSSGYCFVTFSDHTSSVTDLTFTKGNQVVVSASMDGTVRAYDLMRYRNFRTFMSPNPVQFSSVAVDPSGEVVCAGSQDTFEIFLWSMQTGKYLDMLSGHEGPISRLVFRPDGLSIASSSWDHTVRLWDVFDRTRVVERLEHTAEVLAVSYRPDGKEVASSTLDGQILFWDVAKASQTGTVEGRRDISGGRKSGDKQTAENSTSGKSFSSLAYSADGTTIIGGGNSKYVCLYDVKSKILVRKFQISHNQSLDGIKEILNSRNMTEAGAIDQFDSDNDASDFESRQDMALPGVRSGDLSKRKVKKEVRTRGVKFAPTGRQWAAATTEGLMLYSLDDTFIFDPFELDEDVTPKTIRELMKRKSEYLRALVNSLRLNENYLIREVYQTIPPTSVALLAKQFPLKYLERFLRFIASLMDHSQLIELNMCWITALLSNHGTHIKANTAKFQPVLRSLQKVTTSVHNELGSLCDDNVYTLGYIINRCKRNNDQTNGDTSELILTSAPFLEGIKDDSMEVDSGDDDNDGMEE
ncbi:U3 snoRNP protein [Mycoemilia scoparia]|uniref:U3 snoRNP protein n=1 Tax=Mycoemilia scoparia TaxID=417184 RepID=A0A9W8DS90_9FUNG|nr:U3 snoRNP protein [Mycoemilia scoparia]